MAATTYKKYYKITLVCVCVTFSSRSLASTIHILSRTRYAVVPTSGSFLPFAFEHPRALFIWTRGYGEGSILEEPFAWLYMISSGQPTMVGRCWFRRWFRLRATRNAPARVGDEDALAHKRARYGGWTKEAEIEMKCLHVLPSSIHLRDVPERSSGRSEGDDTST